MHTLPLFPEITNSADRLTPSWISAVGFDIARACSGSGWIVLIDPEIIPSKNQCEFYGINPKHLLVVRSSESKSVNQIISDFNRFNTAVAILSWSTTSISVQSHIPVFDIKKTLH